ncbi:MAG: molybdenum cofactor guanylyltransferase [Halodesulfurarchaeum sp.]
MVGAILVCGGRSRRFGDREKALAELDGRPLLRHVADRVEPLVDEVVLSCRRDQEAAIDRALEGYPLPVEYAFDTDVDAGPLHGMRRGFEVIGSPVAFVLACDLPFVDPALLESLVGFLEDHDAAVPLHRGHVQPLAGAYRVAPIRSLLAGPAGDDIDSPMAAVGAVDTAVVDPADLEVTVDDWTLFNVNTPADLRRARDHLE